MGLAFRSKLLACLLILVPSACEDAGESAGPPSHERSAAPSTAPAPRGGDHDEAVDRERPEAPLAAHTLSIAPAFCEGNLSKNGEHPLCASCACGRCSSQAGACASDETCARVAACMHANACSGMACYCGTGVGCLLGARGPCKGEYEAAAGKTGEAKIRAALADGSTALGKANALVSCTQGAELCAAACSADDAHCSFHDPACAQRYCAADPAREQARLASARDVEAPRIDTLRVNDAVVWRRASGGTPVLAPNDRVTLEGVHFGQGPDLDFAKILVGGVRILETDLTMYEQKLDILNQVNYELDTVRSSWPKDILSWSDTRVEFRVPAHVVPTTGTARRALRVSVQKRTGSNTSYTQPGEPHAVLDAQQFRIEDERFPFRCDVVSELSAPRGSNVIDVEVTNPGHGELVAQGRRIYWSYDYNIGLAHSIRGLDWSAIFKGTTRDPITGTSADPRLLFGAYPTTAGEVPAEAIDDVYFKPYPMKSPIPGFLTIGSQKFEGNTRNSGFVGYRYAEAVNPYTGPGKWIGFNCASCHTSRITYQRGAASKTAVFPGLPNPRWSMKWALLGKFEGVVGAEPGPLWAQGNATIDKTPMVYAMPAGTGEHNLIRMNGEGSHTDNDYEFSPIAIPNVTYYLPIRRSLGHTESYVGFEGSYIHSEEPDGAMGSMDAASLKALTAYMGTLDAADDDLRAVGLYRWARFKRLTELPPSVSEGQFVELYTRTMDARAYPALAARLGRGRALFAAYCASCHDDPSGNFSNERMLPLGEVGRFFSPTIYQREMQSIRTTFLRDLYFTQQRGLLTDGHVRSAEDLVHPDRCKEGSALYTRYYTLHEPAASLPALPPDYPAPLPGENPRGDVFRLIKSQGSSKEAKQRNAFIERFRYFTSVPWDADHYYWDYQKLRNEYGPWELGSARPVQFPAAPHPWCASAASEVDDLVLYLMSL